MHPNIKYSLYLILIMLILFLLDKYVEVKNQKNIIENMTNNYTKYEDTIIPGAMLKDPLKGTLDQAKDNCNNNEKCIGVIRKNIEAGYEDDYYIIEKIDYCVNKHNKLPSLKKDTKNNKENKKNNNKENNKDENNNKIKNLIYGNTFSDYSVYLKEETDNSMRCVRLNVPISLKHLKYPFDRLIVDNDFFVRSKSSDNISETKGKSNDKLYSGNGVFNIINGLTGEGISFEVTINNDKYYLINKEDTEDITVSLMNDNSNFKRQATFHMDLSYVVKKGFEDLDNSKYVSIKKTENNRNYYWKINDINKKIVLVNSDDIKDDNDSINTVLFEIIKPLEYTEVSEALEVPAPSMIEEDSGELEETEEKKDMLEKLELDIRELQHDQNLKLMDIMVNVNKFKLMDLSLSDYLTKCTRNSSDQNISILTNSSNINNSSNNSSNNSNNINNSNNNVNNINNSSNNTNK